MKIPARWSHAAIEKAFSEGTALKTINSRQVRVVTDSSLKLALTSYPKRLLHRRIKAGPWTTTWELEAALLPKR